MLTNRYWLLIFRCAALAVFAITAGCATNVPFDYFQEGHKPKGASLAVISGSGDDADVRFAEHLTKKLQERSTLKVLSQAEVGRRSGRYPVKIKIGQPKNPDKPVWYAAGEKGKVDALHDAVKTDYLLVVWVTNLNRYITQNNMGATSVSYGASFIGNLLEYSPGKAVGYTDFGRSRGQSCCLFGVSEGQDIDALLEGSAEDMAAEFAGRTKTEKNR